MINTLLTHKIRKDLIRENKKHNHREYLRALDTWPSLRYWAGYHKKKLIFFGLVALISWNYDIHTWLWHSLLSLRSPREFFNHLLFNEEKVQKTVNEQRIVGWSHGNDTFNLLTRLYYETDKRLIFGVGRNYLFQVYSNMGLLQKPEDVSTFWIGGGFHRRRNQLVSGVSYKEFMSLYCQGFKSLLKINPGLTQQEYLKQFLQLFIQKGPEIISWQKDFNKKRYSQYLKNLVSDHEKKTDEINSLMRENLQITEEQMDQQISQIGMKGLGLQDKWVFWKNKEILLSLREYTLHNRLNLNILQGKERVELERKLNQLERELTAIAKKKQDIRSEYKAIYEQDLI